ncbi:NAD(P)-binding protein, partial [Martensiomyces pterosporus]
TLQTAFTYVGIGVVAYYLSLIITFLYDVFVRPGVKLEKFGAGKGYWAVVTGCTDGLGKEAALELARKKFNVVLISRTQTKLDAMADEVKALGVEAKTLAVDFAGVSADKWAEIAEVLNSVRVGVLVNNVGISYDFPMHVEDVSEETVDALVELNVRAMIKMTRIVLPQMKERKAGLILNNGSFAALIPSPFLAIYSGTKGFVQLFSQSLASEVSKQGIVVEHLQTYFVCSRMSKTRRPNFLIPLPKPYMKTVLAKIGVQGGSSEPFTSIPYFSHALLAFVAERIAPKQAALDYNYNLLSGLRKRALKKLERE